MFENDFAHAQSEPLADLDSGSGDARDGSGLVNPSPGEPTAHAQAALSQETYQPPTRYAEPSVDPAQFYEALQELAEEDPLQAAAVLAEIRAQEVAQAMAEQYEPMFEDFRQRQVESAAEALRGEYGQETLIQILPALEETVAANPAVFENTATRENALRMAIDSILYRGGAPIDPGELTKLQLDAVGGTVDHDVFGVRHIGEREGGVVQMPDGSFAESGTRRVLSPYELAQKVKGRRTVYVEGGSGPQPPQSPPDPLDQHKAQIRGAQGPTDMFGRGAWARW